MCVIVHQPAGSYLTKETAKSMWDRNPDGGGFAYINSDDEIIIEKAMKFNNFWRVFEQHRSENRDKDFLVHFRIATSGEIGLTNTHPFVVADGMVMAHNGMLNHIVGQITLKDEKSDTREFVDLVLAEMPDMWLDNPVLFDMMEEYIGHSKLMFLTNNPDLQNKVYILNKHKGNVRNNMWMSNTHHEPVEKRVSTGSYFAGGKWVSYLSPETTDAKKNNIPQLPVRAVSKADMADSWKRQTSFWDESDILDVKNYWVKPEDTNQELRAILLLRQEADLSQDMHFNSISETWECQTCYSEVSSINGDCRCWDLLCIGCGSLAPMCVHDPEDMELVPVNEAHKVYSEKMESEAKF